jgi:hypothetical protein
LGQLFIGGKSTIWPWIFCDVLRPDLLHRLDLPAHLEGAGLVYGAVIFHFFGIPAAADAEQKAALRHLVQRSDKLGGLNRVALDNEADGCAQLEVGGDGRRRAKRDERVHHVKVLLGQRRFALRVGKPAGDRNVRMFRHPQRVETTLFERHRKLGRRYRVVDEEDRSTDFHVPYLPDCFRFKSRGWGLLRRAASERAKCPLDQRPDLAHHQFH